MSAPPAGPDPRLAGSAAHVVVDDLSSPQLSDADGHHLARVLRLRDGELVTATDGRGAWRECAFRGGEVLEPLGPARASAVPAPRLGVGFAIPKGERPEWIVQKLTEVGVDAIVPFTSARSVVRWDGERGARHVERLRRVALEAAMQSRRTYLPTVQPATTFEALTALDGGSRRVVLAVPGGPPVSGPTLAGVEEVVVLVGPEGGWSTGESERIGCHVGLGANVLRTETAALAAGVLFVTSRAARVSD